MLKTFLQISAVWSSPSSEQGCLSSEDLPEYQANIYEAGCSQSVLLEERYLREVLGEVSTDLTACVGAGHCTCTGPSAMLKELSWHPSLEIWGSLWNFCSSMSLEYHLLLQLHPKLWEFRATTNGESMRLEVHWILNWTVNLWSSLWFTKSGHWRTCSVCSEGCCFAWQIWVLSFLISRLDPGLVMSRGLKNPRGFSQGYEG